MHKPHNQYLSIFRIWKIIITTLGRNETIRNEFVLLVMAIVNCTDGSMTGTHFILFYFSLCEQNRDQIYIWTIAFSWSLVTPYFIALFNWIVSWILFTKFTFDHNTIIIVIVIIEQSKRHTTDRKMDYEIFGPKINSPVAQKLQAWEARRPKINSMFHFDKHKNMGFSLIVIICSMLNAHT